MTRKERVKLAIAHQETDFVPYQIDFTLPAFQKMQKYYNDPDFISKIGNHILGLGTAMGGEEVKPDFWRDEWGVIWDRRVDKDIGTVCNVVIEEKRDLDRLEFPDPRDPRRYAYWEEAISRAGDMFIVANLGFSLFERAWTLRGMENLLCDMLWDEGFVDELLDRILDFNLAVIEEATKYPIDGFMFGDDWGQQRGLIMGPRLWRRFIKPRIAKMYQKVHEAGLPVFIHSCGDVEDLFPELIEVGVDVFNPFQPEVMDVYKIKEKYGDKLCFWGGVSTQRTLPYGTPEDVREEAKRLMREIGKGGGYILAPAHSIPKDVPAENIAALIETVALPSVGPPFRSPGEGCSATKR